MADIFISYRRSDAQDVTGRIYDRLTEAWSEATVFRDIDSIPIGAEFPEYLRDAVMSSKAVVVVIGPSWLSACDIDGNRRLDNPEDYVRREIALALSLGRAVVPITVSNATMPPISSLPSDIADLSHRNGLQVRPDPDFHNDVDRLIKKLGRLIGREPLRQTYGKRSSRPYPVELLIWSVLLLASMGWFVGQRPEWVKQLFWRGGILSAVAYAIPGAADGGIQGGLIWSVTSTLSAFIMVSSLWFIHRLCDRDT